MTNVSTSSVAGVVAGKNPLIYSPSSPYTIFLFQSILILTLCQILHWPMKKLRQPRVISEVVTGIVLGPTAMGRIPGFTRMCFPDDSKPGLTLVANIGIILFLFIVGMEVDLKYIKKNATAAISVGIINMAIPFALGCGIAKALYNEYQDPDRNISFTTQMVFIAVAMCITAFPVLVRILVELNLIGDQVGTIVLSSGIINDLTGWILLALAVTLANADNGLHTLYILLLAVAWFFVLMYPVKYLLGLYLRKFTTDLTTGQPSPLSMTIVILMVFISAFYTDIIGVHPIFGAFMVGVIIPRDNGYVIRITEKLEDLIYVLMIPVYFAVVGLSVDLAKLNRGIDWAFCIAVIALAMIGKVLGGFVGASLNGFCWRDSLTVGVLMSCKGIVEIIVLNVGLSANIISERVYSMFVVMAVVTTFLTTPLTMWIYPQKYRKGTSNWRNDIKGTKDEHEEMLSQATTQLSIGTLDRFGFTGILLLLKRIDNISNLMLFLRDLKKEYAGTDICAVHLREFTSRTSHLLEASSAGNSTKNEQEYADSISILSIVRAFSMMLDINFSAKSLLTPINTFMVPVNDLVSGPANFLLTSASATGLLQPRASSEGEFDAYSQVMRECKCHVGVLIPSKRKFSQETKTIRLILNQDDRLSTSDLLSLHLVRILAQVHRQIHVYIRSSASRNKQFESQFDEYLESSREDLELSISYFKAFSDVEETKEQNLAGSMFVVSYEFMEENLDEILRLGQSDQFDILVMRASK